MTLENQILDQKSIRVCLTKTTAWRELAKDCVAFANAQGGSLLVGIEDGELNPPSDQRIPSDLETRLLKRIGELTTNVVLAVQRRASAVTGGEFLDVTISRSVSPASTTDGRFFLRVGDTCVPLVGEDIQRLLNERSAQPWETLTHLQIMADQFDTALLSAFVSGIRLSDRVKDSVKEKSDDELLDHYFLVIDGLLTNLGILCIGRREDRARLGTAPIIQFLKYDADGNRVNKIVWDDYALSPLQLIEDVWKRVPDFRESYEIPDGLFRHEIPVYDKRVIRELLVNALVHRPYTQRGDIFISVTPSWLKIVNPGLLPLGVTPQNILHQSVRRNNELARVFHDLKLMEREGSGYDLLYEVLLSQGRALPVLCEGVDSVEVQIGKRIINPKVIDFLAKVSHAFPLNQRERIALGLLAQKDVMTASELATTLELSETGEVNVWIGRLQKWGLVCQTGRTKGTRYFIEPRVLQHLEFPSLTNLARIESHRLDALVLEDVVRYPGSAISDVCPRVGLEISRRQVKASLDRLCKKNAINPVGERRGRKYWPTEKVIDKTAPNNDQ